MAQIKLFDPFTRIDGTTLEHFSTHWHTRHAEIAKGLPQIKHYIQSHRREDAPAALGAPLGACWADGSSETWYDGPEEITAMFELPALTALMEDERNFMDTHRERYHVITREQHIDGPELSPCTGVKALLFTRRDPALTQEDFFAAWITPDDAELGRAVGATRHVVCPRVASPFDHPNPEVEESSLPPFDGVRELWWESTEALAAGAAADPDAWARLVHPPTVDAGGSFALYASERLIIR
ncbi:unannotated protein [freshwater metagenome]|uniref:Unannotated protein n=1 Tax=freshwater metagenome TaxID=449393 RepID=A0A6J7J4L1_9ZZZZ|nr:hypothetical protein [Actinomycetota bacterium]